MPKKEGGHSPETPFRDLAKKYKLEEIHDLSKLKLERSWFAKVPYSFVKKNLLLPLLISDNTLLVALHDPLNLNPLEELRFMTGHEIKTVFATKELIQEGLNLCYHQKAEETTQKIKTLEGGKGQQDEEIEAYDLLDEDASSSPVVKTLNLILLEAIQQDASDIHFEPTETDLRIRYRIDGVLQDRHAPTKEFQAPMLARIKVMAKLDIAEQRLPQDGRIKLKMGGREINFRVSTLPVSGGERIVLRILDKGNIVLGLDKLKMPENIRPIFEKHIRLPEGIVLVTGPTGSGKTTTLYSALLELRGPKTNIITIEDPVEYKFSGIAQMAVRHKINLNFATGLRHILRQDPDVIMVGEIRDRETAEIAVQAALTGHLVLSTLHTNNAPSAITRLADMGIEPYLLSSSVIGILAQRLVRTICPSCKESYKPEEEELKELGIKRNEVSNGVFYRGKGCQSCFSTGYKGRQGVYEYMPVSSTIKQQIGKSCDSEGLRKIALEEGMLDLRTCGNQLVISGVTTTEEVLRVTRGTD